MKTDEEAKRALFPNLLYCITKLSIYYVEEETKPRNIDKRKAHAQSHGIESVSTCSDVCH